MTVKLNVTLNEYNGTLGVMKHQIIGLRNNMACCYYYLMCLDINFQVQNSMTVAKHAARNYSLYRNKTFTNEPNLVVNLFRELKLMP